MSHDNAIVDAIRRFTAAHRRKVCPNPWHVADHFTPGSCPDCGARWSPGPAEPEHDGGAA